MAIGLFLFCMTLFTLGGGYVISLAIDNFKKHRYFLFGFDCMCTISIIVSMIELLLYNPFMQT